MDYHYACAMSRAKNKLQDIEYYMKKNGWVYKCEGDGWAIYADSSGDFEIKVPLRVGAQDWDRSVHFLLCDLAQLEGRPISEVEAGITLASIARAGEIASKLLELDVRKAVDKRKTERG